MTGGGFIAGSIVGKLLLDKTGWNQSISAVDKDAAKLKDSAKQIGVQFDAVGQKMQAMGIKMAAAGAVITGAMGLIITKTANLGDEFYDLSQRTGIAVEMLSSFKLAADKSGTSIGGFATGMKGLSRVMFEAASGSKEAQGAFKSIGVSATDSSGKLRPLDQVMMDVADRFSAMDDGAVKSALAMKLFGKSGIDLIPMLNLGRAGLEAEADAAQRLGLVMSTETAKACDKFNDSLADLKGGVQGAFQQIAMTLIPSLTRLTEKVVGVIGKVTAWAKEHPGLTRAISGTVLGLGALLTVLGTAIVVVGTVLRQVPLLISGLQALKGLLANPMALIIITSIPILTKATANFVYELKNMNSTMRESGQSGFISFLEGVNSGIRRVALGMKDSNIVLSEANALALLFAREGGRGTRDILLADADAANKFIPALDTVKEKVQSLQEQLGITFRAETEERIKKLNEALLLYRGKLTAEEIARIYGEINTLTESLTRLKGPVFDLDAAIKGMLDGLDDTAEEVASAIATLFDDGFEEIKRAGEQVIENDLPTYLRDLPPVVKTVTKETSHYFDGMLNDIARAFGDAISKWCQGLTTFKDFANSIWGNIKDAFFRMIGEMITKWTINFITKILMDLGVLTTSVSAATGAITTSFSAAFGEIAAAAASLVISIGFIAVAVFGVLSAFGLFCQTAAEVAAACAKEKAAIHALWQKWIDLGYSIREANERMKEWLKLTGQQKGGGKGGGEGGGGKSGGGGGGEGGGDGRTPRTPGGGEGYGAEIGAVFVGIGQTITNTLAAAVITTENALKKVGDSSEALLGVPIKKTVDGVGQVIMGELTPDLLTGLDTMKTVGAGAEKSLGVPVKKSLKGIQGELEKTIPNAFRKTTDAMKKVGDSSQKTMGNPVIDTLDDIWGEIEKLGKKISKVDWKLKIKATLPDLSKLFGEGGKKSTNTGYVAASAPEVPMPVREYRTAQASAVAGGRNSNVNLTFNIRALDGTDMINVVHNKIKPILQNILNHNGLRVPTGAVGGA